MIITDWFIWGPLSVGQIHIFGSGFPCQPYSAIGKRKGSKDKRSRVANSEPSLHINHCTNILWMQSVDCQRIILLTSMLMINHEVVNRIRRMKPESFILENVKGLVSKRNKKFFGKLLSRHPVSNQHVISNTHMIKLIILLLPEGFKWKEPMWSTTRFLGPRYVIIIIEYPVLSPRWWTAWIPVDYPSGETACGLSARRSRPGRVTRHLISGSRWDDSNHRFV